MKRRATSERLDAAFSRVMEAVRIDSRSAADRALEATSIAEELGDEGAIARARLATAWAHAATSDFAAALAPAAEAADRFAALGDDPHRAEAGIVVGMARLRLGELDEARTSYRAALEISRAAGDRLHESDALSSLSAHSVMIGDYAGALGLGEEAVTVAREAASDARLADAHTAIANALMRLGRYDESRGHLDEAVEFARRSGEIRLEAYALGGIGTILERLGDPAGAIVYQERSLALSEQLGDRWGINGILNNIAIVHQRLGKYSEALDYLTRALELAEETGEPDGQAAALANIGMLFDAIGERGRVLEYFTRSHAIAERVGDRPAIANTLILLGRHHSLAGDEKLALLSFMRALRLHEEMGDRHGRFGALYNMGQALHRIGDFEGSIERLGEALELAAGGGDHGSSILIRIALAKSHSGLSIHDRAIELLEQALANARSSGTLELVLRALDALTEAYRAAGRAADAIASAAASGELLRVLFDSGETHRIRQLVERLDARSAHRRASELGVAPADMEEIARMLDRVRMRSASAPEIERSPEPAPIITVVTFGELRVSVGDRQVTLADWKRKRARDLFKLLLLHHRRSLSLDRIVELLGGASGDRGAEMVIMNAVSHVRRALEPEKPSRERTSYLRHADGAYMLDLGEGASIDFLRFKELVAKARRAASAGERRTHYEAALALYHDDFLKEDLDAEWAESERSMLRDARLEALEFLASEQLRQESVEEAITTARSILGEDNTSERAHEILLQALVLRGRHGEAQAAVQAMTRAFRDELGMQPPPHLMRMIDRATA
jgi:tetratricopeptide (TPR) repeat protein